MNWRLHTLHFVAKLLGVLIHVDGRPLGAPRILPESERGSGSCGPEPA